jgi:SAM-dependent methyltransferase
VTSQSYSTEFFSRLHDGAARSAREIAPLVTSLVAPASVVDVGCGRGVWLSEFQRQGITDVFGVDGAWVDPETLVVPRDRFLSADLEQPLYIPRQFDLAISLEVAEHLVPECADAFVDSLVRLAPAVLFSAAVPFQGGVGHVNEQWPEYWAALFDARGYVPVDCIRPRISRNADVEWWYSQNVLLFVRADHLAKYPLLAQCPVAARGDQLTVIHPHHYLHHATRPSNDPATLGVMTLLSAFPKALTLAVRRRLLPKKTVNQQFGATTSK